MSALLSSLPDPAPIPRVALDDSHVAEPFSRWLGPEGSGPDAVEISPNWGFNIICSSVQYPAHRPGLAKSLEKLVRAQLAPFIGTDQARLEIDGLAVSVTAEVVQTLGLALHELATNASKYGALSVPGGDILLQWKFTGGDSIPEGFRLERRVASTDR